MGCSPPGSSAHGILQARILEWVAFSSPGDLSDPGIQHIMGYYSAVIRNRVPVSVITWMKHENIKLSERS